MVVLGLIECLSYSWRIYVLQMRKHMNGFTLGCDLKLLKNNLGRSMKNVYSKKIKILLIPNTRAIVMVDTIPG